MRRWEEKGREGVEIKEGRKKKGRGKGQRRWRKWIGLGSRGRKEEVLKEEGGEKSGRRGAQVVKGGEGMKG